MIENGCWGDLETWVHDDDVHQKIYRVWFKDSKQSGCDYYYFAQIIPLGYDIMIGLVLYDDTSDTGKSEGMIEYHLLSSFKFAYYESDQDYYEDDDDDEEDKDEGEYKE